MTKEETNETPFSLIFICFLIKTVQKQLLERVCHRADPTCAVELGLVNVQMFSILYVFGDSFW